MHDNFYVFYRVYLSVLRSHNYITQIKINCMKQGSMLRNCCYKEYEDPLDPILSQLNPSTLSTHYSSKIPLNMIVPLKYVSQMDFFFQFFLLTPCVHA